MKTNKQNGKCSVKNLKQSNSITELIVLRCDSTKAAIVHSGITLERLRACGHNGEVLFIGKSTDLFYYEWGTEPREYVSLGAYNNSVARELGTTLRRAIKIYNIQFNNPHA